MAKNFDKLFRNQDAIYNGEFPEHWNQGRLAESYEEVTAAARIIDRGWKD